MPRKMVIPITLSRTVRRNFIRRGTATFLGISRLKR